jgi:hypothetical protein
MSTSNLNPRASARSAAASAPFKRSLIKVFSFDALHNCCPPRLGGENVRSQIGKSLPNLLRKFLQSPPNFASLLTWGAIPTRTLLSFAARSPGSLYELTVS